MVSRTLGQLPTDLASQLAGLNANLRAWLAALGRPGV